MCLNSQIRFEQTEKYCNSVVGKEDLVEMTKRKHWLRTKNLAVPSH